MWDNDEGLNSEASREMLVSGNYIVPTFNYQLRSAKPILLYWCQIGCYQLFGVNEASARLPSALAALLAVLVVYELGRAMFTLHTGLLAAVLFACSISILGAAHFANPDALLLAFSALTLAAFFRYDQTQSRGWIYLAGIAAGFAALAKGPVGLILPGAIVFVYLLWQRRLRQLFTLPIAESFGWCLLVAAPWYVWVAVETRGQFLREFWFQHHMNRVQIPLEDHHGSPFYYLIALCVGLFPGSLFLAASIWHTGLRLRESGEDRSAVRFLVVWFAIFFVAFSIVRTKLPNYILPLYPAAVLLTAWTLERWRTGAFVLHRGFVGLSVGIFAIVGVAITLAALQLGGAVDLGIPQPWTAPDLAHWCWIGVFPVLGAIVATVYLVRRQRDGVLTSLTVASIACVASIAAGALTPFNVVKPQASLAALLPADHEFREVRLGAFCYERPTLVYYCRREVRRLVTDEQAYGFLAEPLPAYMFIEQTRWENLASRMPPGVHVLGSYPDFYLNGRPILVIANDPGHVTWMASRASTLLNVVRSDS